MERTEFGDYLLLKKLAAGGMGEVFLARQLKGAGFERYVAIKRILPDLSGDDEFVRMFLDEARLAAQLTHPNIVEIYDLGICGDQYYIAMEFLEGRDLRRIMSRLSHRRRALPGAHAIQAVYNAAEGLHHAHELTDATGLRRNIIHRDVSPQNIFVTFDGTVKLLDFGIAKAETRTVRTRTGGLKGKYPYMSPEQVRGEAVDRRTDIFSLGVILWEITVGRRLFRRENDLLTLNAVLKCEVPRPGSLMDRYPPELERVVMRALEKDPEERYGTCRELQEELEVFMTQHGLVLSPQKLGRSVRRLFNDEPATVKEVLDSLKEKPKSKSLLQDDQGSSASRPPAGPQPGAPDESSEISGPSPTSSPGGRSASLSFGGGPLVGFDSGDGSGSSERSAPSGGVVPVLWTAESESAAGVDPASVEVELDEEPPAAEAPEAEAEADSGGPELDGARREQGWVSRGVVDVERLAAEAATLAILAPEAEEDDELRSERAKTLRNDVIALEPDGAEPPDPRGLAADPVDAPTRPRPAEGAEQPADRDGPARRWIASAPTAVKSWAEIEASRVAAEPTLVPPAASGPAPGPARGASSARLALVAGGALLLVAGLAALVLVSRSGAGRAGAGPELAALRSPPDAGSREPRDGAAASPAAAGQPGGGSTMAWVADAGERPAVDGGAAPAVVADADADAARAEVAPPVPGAAEGRVELQIATSPPGLSVFVGREHAGTSPVSVLVSPGEHFVRLRSKAAGIEFGTQLRVAAGERRRETITVPQGTLALVVRPYATVFVDGRRHGLTPMPPVSLYVGRHRVRLVNDSLGRTVDRTVTIRAGHRTILEVDMNAAP